MYYGRSRVDVRGKAGPTTLAVAVYLVNGLFLPVLITEFSFLFSNQNAVSVQLAPCCTFPIH